MYKQLLIISALCCSILQNKGMDEAQQAKKLLFNSPVVNSPRRLSTTNPLHNYKPTSPRTQAALASPKEDRKNSSQDSGCCTEKWNCMLYHFLCLSCWHHCCSCKDHYQNL